MKEGYLILSGMGGSFGNFALIPEVLFKALEDESIDDLSDEMIMSLNQYDENLSLEKIKQNIQDILYFDGQEMYCTLANLAYHNRLPKDMYVFKSATEMVDFVKENNITILGDTY
jgi:hypothetical protein